jgi:hypothetical protein
MGARKLAGSCEATTYELELRGEIPKALRGSLIVAASRRNKSRDVFSRWHDSQADIIRLDLETGSPGRVLAHVLPIDSTGRDLGTRFRRGAVEDPTWPAYGYATQPNHGLNVSGTKLWATNLLYGAPLQIDLEHLRAERILRYVNLRDDAPRVTTTSHFAWSLDRRYAYFHQSLLRMETSEKPVTADDLRLVRLDVRTGQEKVWRVIPPPGDARLDAANFHSAFYWEEKGKKYVGLLRTGAVVEQLEPHSRPEDHVVHRMPPSSIWVIEIDPAKDILAAGLLPGIVELNGLALSHLDVDVSTGDGFILYANYKQADVAEETHGVNAYGQPAETIAEHYSGMVIEAMNVGKVIRYERRNGRTNIKCFERAYDDGRASLGHTWLPINIQLDASGEHLFCTFSGLRPRLLSKHVVDAYPDLAVDPQSIRFVPPLLMRLDAKTLQPPRDKRRNYLSYWEPIAMTVVGDFETGYVCTFSPDEGLHIYRANDLTMAVCTVMAHDILHYKETHFRPEPAHMVFIPQ